VAPNAPDSGPSCDERRQRADHRVDEAIEASRQCSWDVECVVIDPSTECRYRCRDAVAAGSVVRARASIDEVSRGLCAGYAEDECPGERIRCANMVAYCQEGRCLVRQESMERPERPRLEPAPQNAPTLTEPPARPPLSGADERARRLFDAIVHDDPDRAMDFFFPSEAFDIVKAIPDPMAYYRRLLARYLQDIHDLHQSTPDLDRAQFVRLDLVRRGGWVAVREEGNRLPYWASRHSAIVYRVDDQERRLEVRVLITWGERWYVIHLSEFH
jgi:hypothetical protein